MPDFSDWMANGGIIEATKECRARQSFQHAKAANRFMTDQEQQEDVRLLQAVALRRDREALGQLFERHHEPAFNLALRVCGNRQTAEDAVQAGFLRIWLRAECYEELASVQSWILRIVARECLMQLRTDNRRRRRDVQKADIITKEHGMKEKAEPENNELLALLRKGLAELPELEQRLLSLYFGAEMSQQEISAQMQLSQSAISIRIREALKDLRLKLAQAGAMAVIPQLDELLPRAVLGGELVPQGGWAEISAKLSARLPGKPWHTHLASAGPWAAGIVLIATTGYLGYYWHAQAGTRQTAINQPTNGNLFQRRWVFENDKLPEGFQDLASNYGKPAQGGSGLQFPPAGNRQILLLEKLPDRPLLIETTCSLPQLGSESYFLCLPTDGKSLPPSTGSNVSKAGAAYERAKFKKYLWKGRYVTQIFGQEIEGHIETTSDDKMLYFSGHNILLHDMTIREIAPEALPEIFRRKSAAGPVRHDGKDSGRTSIPSAAP